MANTITTIPGATAPSADVSMATLLSGAPGSTT